MLKLLSGAALASLLAAGAASAATLTFSPGASVNSGNPTASATSGTVFENTTGSVGGLRLSPYEGGDPSDDGFLYTSVSGGATATYTFGSDITGIEFIYGSPDTYNTLTFYNDGQIVDTYAYDGSQGTGLNIVSDLATVRASAFDTVVFASGQNAFEFAQLAAVPLPAAGLLLLGALGAMGVARRRKAA